MRQYKGCSHLYYAIETEAADGTLSFGTPKQLAPVKSVARDISSDNEKVYADNTVQQDTFGATNVTRDFECTRIPPANEAELLGDDTLTVGDYTAYLTAPDGSVRPNIAVGYALYDGDPDSPVGLYWAYRGKTVSISKSAQTIDDSTGSEGQTVQITQSAPKKAWTATGKRNLDFKIERADTDDPFTEAFINKFFAQVVTPDNAATVLA